MLVCIGANLVQHFVKYYLRSSDFFGISIQKSQHSRFVGAVFYLLLLKINHLAKRDCKKERFVIG